MEQFDHHTEDFAENWREIYRGLRGSCPVPHTDAHGGFHVITRYDDVKRVMQDPETFACGRDLQVGGTVTGGVTIPINPVQMGMMETDPPVSQAYRRPIANLFTSKAITAFEPRMAEIISWAVDRVIEGGRLDFVDDLANPIPAMISLDYFGLPLDKWETYATALHKAAYREKGSARAVMALVGDIQSIVADRRATAGQREDVVDRLLTAEVNGSPLSEDEVVNQIFMLLNGGIDTSTALIAGMFGYLGEHPDERAALAADPSLIPNAVDEMLRYFTPGPGRRAHGDGPRRTQRDCAGAGRSHPAGAGVGELRRGLSSTRPRRSASTGRTPPSTWPSATACTAASGPSSPRPRCACCWRRCCAGCPTTRSTSRPSCTTRRSR